MFPVTHFGINAERNLSVHGPIHFPVSRNFTPFWVPFSSLLESPLVASFVTQDDKSQNVMHPSETYMSKGLV